MIQSTAEVHASSNGEVEPESDADRTRRRVRNTRNGRIVTETPQGVQVMDRLEEEDARHLREEETLSNGNTVKPDVSRQKSSWLDLTQILPRMSDYVLALRPWSFSASFTPVALGAALAYKNLATFNIPVFLMTCLIVLAVHGAGNLVNTYYDYVKGVDRETRSDDRTLVDHRLTMGEVANLGVLVYTIGLFGFMFLSLMSCAKMEHLALVYFGGLSCSFLYTGGVGFKYVGLGDIIILIIFGPLSLLFSYMAQTGTVDLATVAYALPLALNTEAILHSNNTRDIENDRRAGAVTLAILIGPTLSHVLYAVLLFVPYILFTVVGFHYSGWFWLPIITLPQAFKLEREFRAGHLQRIPRKTAKLNLYFGLFYVVACCLTDSSRLPLLQS